MKEDYALRNALNQIGRDFSAGLITEDEAQKRRKASFKRRELPIIRSGLTEDQLWLFMDYMNHSALEPELWNGYKAWIEGERFNPHPRDVYDHALWHWGREQAEKDQGAFAFKRNDQWILRDTQGQINGQGKS